MKKIVKTNLEMLEIIANALVSDIVNVLKRGTVGYFYLPDEELGEGIYFFDNLNMSRKLKLMKKIKINNSPIQTNSHYVQINW